MNPNGFYDTLAESDGVVATEQTTQNSKVPQPRNEVKRGRNRLEAM